MKLAAKNSDIPDPQTFIRSEPLPFPSHKGVKIQARSFNVYNARIPKREDIRKENYNRRLEQLTSMGFRTPINVPYKVIGDPLYLDHKNIILYGLGQLKKEPNQTEKSFIRQSINLNKTQQELANKNQATQKFTIKNFSKNKNLINLSSEVNKAKDLIKRVQLGQSLFGILEEDEIAKRKKLQLEKEQNLSAMQLRPMQDSEDEDHTEQYLSEDDTYNDMNRIFDNTSPGFTSTYTQGGTGGRMITPSTNLNDYHNTESIHQRNQLRLHKDDTNIEKNQDFDEGGTNGDPSHRPQTYPVQNLHIKQRPHTVAGQPTNSVEKRSAYSGSIRPKTTTDKMLKNSKPYTPIYSTLLSKSEAPLMDRISITRQLCILLWLLDSIGVESPSKNIVGPLRTCFSINELGGEKLNEKVVKRLNEIESTYKEFISKSGPSDKVLVKAATIADIKSTRKAKPANNPHKNVMNENLHDNDFEGSRDNFGKRRNETPSSGINDLSFADEDYLATTANNTNIKSLSSKKQNLGESTYSLNNMLSESAQELPQLNVTDKLNFNTLNSANINQLNTQYSNSSNNNTNQNFESFNNKLDTQRESEDKFTNRGNEDNQNLVFYGINSQKESSMAHQSNNNANFLSQSLNDAKHFKSDSTTRHKKFVKTKPKPFKGSLADHEIEILKIGDVAEMDKILNKTGSKQDRRNSKSLKAHTGPIHALWTQKVIDFQNKQPSIKNSQTLIKIKEDFNNLMNERSIDIHKKLLDLINKRPTTCKVKYSNISLSERGIHNILNKMNESMIEYQRLEDSKNAPQPKYYQWFLDLKSLVDSNINRDDIVISELLKKLSAYGKLNAKKQNEAHFLQVLKTLRTWELLSPDVMSAIEFCRERILEFPLDEFEDWFQTNHPEAFRARTDKANDNNNKSKSAKEKK